MTQEVASPYLSPAEKIYYFLHRRQRDKWSGERTSARRPDCALIAVGNITTGGTGKTPAVQWLARKLAAPGRKIAVVARGYGGGASATGAVVSDGSRLLLDAAHGGDEPVLHGRCLSGVPVLIGRDRNAAVQRAIDEFGVNVIVLDDAFQYWSLPRDFDLVLLDARRPFDNGHLLPKGRLRELPSSLERADAILLTRSDLATSEQIAQSRRLITAHTGAPVFLSSHRPVALRDEASGERLALNRLHGYKVATISALADNEAFARTLEPYGARVVATVGKRDHHRWQSREIRQFARQAKAKGAEALLTTEKDAVKIEAAWTEGLPLWSLVIELRVEAENELLAPLQRRLERVVQQTP